jgi:hypothetical protein
MEASVQFKGEQMIQLLNMYLTVNMRELARWFTTEQF